MGSPCSTSSGYSSEEHETAIEEYDYSPVCSDIEEDKLAPAESNLLVSSDSQIFDFTTLLREEESNMSLPEEDRETNAIDHRSITQLDEFKVNYLRGLLELFAELSRQRTMHQQDFVSERTLYGLMKALKADFVIQMQVVKILKNILR